MYWAAWNAALFDWSWFKSCWSKCIDISLETQSKNTMRVYLGGIQYGSQRDEVFTLIVKLLRLLLNVMDSTSNELFICLLYLVTERNKKLVLNFLTYPKFCMTWRVLIFFIHLQWQAYITVTSYLRKLQIKWIIISQCPLDIWWTLFQLGMSS